MKRVFFLAFFLFIFQNAQADEQKLSQAYEQQLIERVRGVFSSEAAKEEIKRPICATPIFLEVKANWERLSAETRKILQSYTLRPTFEFPEYTYDTPQGHFKVHYVREGNNAVFNPDIDKNFNGHPDWVDTVGMVLEHVWDVETGINALGYKEPPSDGWYHDTVDNGGDGKYDVYLLNLAKFLGYTQGEFFLSPYSISATSFIVLDNDYVRSGHSQIEWLQVTAAHEFFHAIQLGYDGTEYEVENEAIKPYWMEMSAVWMEEMVYDHVNDYLGYLSSFFNHPSWSLKTFSYEMIVPDSAYHPYGSCIWPMFLQERFDTTIIKDIWEECAKDTGNNAIDYHGGESATDKALKARGVNFEEVFREFTVWNYFTADRERTQLFYSEGNLFPKVKVDSLHYHTNYKDTIYSSSAPNHPYNLGSNYVVFVPDPELKEGGISIGFAGSSGDYKVSVVGYKSYPSSPFESALIGMIDVYDWNYYMQIVMIPAVVTRSPDDHYTYEYRAFYDSSLHGEPTLPDEDKILQNYPNPFVVRGESDRTFFPFILSSPSRVRIDIFTLSGERIRTVVPKYDLKLGSEEYTHMLVLQELDMFWDGKNEEGECVSSGVYLYRFKTDRTTVVKKMAVIR